MGMFELARVGRNGVNWCMAQTPGKKKAAKQRKAIMLGVGLDTDGHKRLTGGPNFALVGGSSETHDIMTEKVMKINEKLAAKGKALEEVSRDEFDDIAAEVGLHKLPRDRSK